MHLIRTLLLLSDDDSSQEIQCVTCSCFLCIAADPLTPWISSSRSSAASCSSLPSMARWPLWLLAVPGPHSPLLLSPLSHSTRPRCFSSALAAIAFLVRENEASSRHLTLMRNEARCTFQDASSVSYTIVCIALSGIVLLFLVYGEES